MHRADLIQQLTGRLKNLEKRLRLSSNNQLDLVNGEFSGNIDDRVNELKKVNSKLGFQENKVADNDDDVSTQKDRGDGPAQEHSVALEKSESFSNNEMFYSGQSAHDNLRLRLDSWALFCQWFRRDRRSD